MQGDPKAGQASIGGLSLYSQNDQDWGALASVRHTVFPHSLFTGMALCCLLIGQGYMEMAKHLVLLPIGG